MNIERISSVVPVDDLGAAVTQWATLLGTEATFVDGDRWAQFDVGTARLALAGTDRASDAAGVMIKVDDIDAARDAYSAAGLSVGTITDGAHERRADIDGFAVPITIYASR